MKLYVFLLSLLASVGSVHALNTTASDATELAQTLLANKENLFLVGTPVLVGNASCAHLFSGGKAAVPDTSIYGTLDFPDEGFVLSTGLASKLPGQDSGKISYGFRTSGSVELSEEARLEFFAEFNIDYSPANGDACALELQFECTVPDCEVAFDYVWGSDEYNEYVNSQFNDAFGFYLNGENIAKLPSGDRVSIDNVNKEKNSEFYINNDIVDFDPVPFPDFEADGFTKVLVARGNANTGVNTLKLVIADFGNLGFDSWVLFRKSSLVIPPPTLPPPPPPGGTTGGGDPHFTRWSHERRDSFHGECDLVVLHSEKFHNNDGLDFHVRTTMHDELYSYIESAALRLGEDILEVHNGHILLNGAEYKDEDMPVSFGGKTFDVTAIEQDGKGGVRRRTYRLQVGSNFAIDFKYYKNLMTYHMNGHEEFNGALGLVGAYPTGDMIGRDGRKIDNFIDFGFEWQVGLEDPVLFSDLRAPQLPYERCRMPTKAQTSRRLRGVNRALTEQAQLACSHVPSSNFELCVDDVVMTGDLELAKEW